MKVVLLKDVKGSGKAGQIVEISDGYARNYLLPKKLAVEATSASINTAKAKADAEAHKKAVEEANAKALAAKLNGTSISMTVKAGEGGKLFGSITNKEVAALLQEKCGLEVDKKKVIIKEAIKQTGEYDVEIKLFPNIATKVKLAVSAE